MRKFFVIGLISAAVVLAACGKKENDTALNVSTNTNSAAKNANTAIPTEVTEEGFVPSESGTEKEKPEAGKANVQGKALFNEKPAADVEVKLCETFNQFSGCSGKEYKTKTDAGGEYLIKGVEPKAYDALLVKVFNTNNSIFASSKFGISAAKYKFEADKTFFAPTTNLFKSDIKVQSPKANAKIDAKNPSVSAPYVNEKTEAVTFKAEKPISDGEYNFKLEAFNANDIKLAETPYTAFTVTGGQAAAPSADMPANK